MSVRKIGPGDWPEWLRMSLALFPDYTAAELEPGMRGTLALADAAVFIADRPDGTSCGFVEVGSRSYADGCDTAPVAYIEAWYVDPDVRRRGYGRALFAAAEDWARASGYREIGSDTLLDNTISQRAHERMGYREVGRIAQFAKRL